MLDFTSFLSEHPGGELATILTFAGKDATEEFNLIHPPNIIGKDASDAVIGKVGSGVAAAAGTAPKAGLGGPARKDKGSMLGSHQVWGHLYGDPCSNWRVNIDDDPDLLLINVKSYLNTTWFPVLAMLYEVCATPLSEKNIKISDYRLGSTRSEVLLILFIVIHAVGTLHVFKGPDDSNGHGYSCVRLYWTGLGLPANIVEEYILLSVLLHAFVDLKRPWDMKLAPGGSQGISVHRLAISRLIFLTFMTIHLLQFRFDDTDQSRLCYIKPPPYLISFWRITSLNLFRTNEGGIQPVGVRDICALELRLHETLVVLPLHPLRALLPVPSGEHPAELPRPWISPLRGHFRERRGLPVWRCSSQQGWKRHQPSGEHPAGHAHPRIPCELLGNFSNCQDVTGGAVRLFGCPPQWTGCCNTKGRFSSPCFDVGVFGGGDRLLWNHPALPHNFPWPGHLAAFVPGC